MRSFARIVRAAVLVATCACSDSDDTPKRCVITLGEGAPGAAAMAADAPASENERSSAAPDERVSLEGLEGAEAERLATAWCNDPPEGEERVVTDADGTVRCAFGLREREAGSDGFTYPRGSPCPDGASGG